MRSPTVFTSRLREEFIEYLKVAGNAAAAARAVGVSYSTVRDYYLTDDAFRQAWDDAMALAGGTLEAAVYRRAIEGVKRPKVLKDGTFVRWPADHPQAGEIYYEVQHDAAREALLLKRFLPEEYRERSETRVRGSLQTSDMDDETLLARAAQILEDAKLRGEGETGDGVRTVDLPAPEDVL